MSLFGFEPWTPVEEATLCEVYPIGGKRAALAALPNRSADSIKNKAQGLGLSAAHLRKGGVKPYDDWSDRVPQHDYTAPDFAWQATRITPPPAEFRSLGVRL